MKSLPRLGMIDPLAGERLPRVSIIFAARDESAKLPAAASSMLALDYPNYEIVSADDRSSDDTGSILDEFASRDTRLRVVHIADLPDGWLGKPHALEEASKLASGEWLLFTDADVQFAPDVVRRALALVKDKHWDHLTLLADVEMRGFWEKVAISYFGFCFVFGVQPWRVSNPKSSAYIGVGAFQMVRRSAYIASGTHRRLAMEVLDDMKLGKIIKESGFRSGTAGSDGLVRVRWQDGFGAVVRGVTKNLFASFGFRVSATLLSILLVLVTSALPFAGIFFAHGTARMFSLVAAVCAVLVHGGLIHETGESRLYGLTHPLGALVFVYMILRSMILTLWRGGIIWRQTFYPLKDLRRGVV